MREARVSHFPKVLVNHVGFHPQAGKFVVVDGVRGATQFKVINMRQRGFQPRFTGTLARVAPDLGEYLVGDFSEFREPGLYRIAVTGNYGIANKEGTLDCWSHNFTLHPNAWEEAIRKLVHYYRVQSCGPSKHGYNTPCHLGPIPRSDGGEAVPLTGGWHSAHDHSRTAAETMYGSFGLLGLANARPDLVNELDLGYEMRWGNDFFLKTQHPAGFLYQGIGSPVYMQFTEYDWWDSANYQLNTEPAPRYLQHSFLTLQALLSLFFQSRDAVYARHCLEAGQRGFDWLESQPLPDPTCYDLGTGISAGVHLYRACGEERYRSFAREMASQLVARQAPEGYFQEWSYPQPEQTDGDSSVTPERACYAHQTLLGLIEITQWLEKDPERPRWLSALQRFAEHYVRHFAEANAFGILPNRVFADYARQASRRWKNANYRYFLETNYWSDSIYWQAGDIAVRAGYGTCLVYLAEVLNEPWLRRLAHRQLDWALGVNPFDSSMIWGIGRNQPPTYPSLEMIPPVPDIPGAVFQGIGGDENDNPLVIPGCYVTCEFWMPHQASLLWLMAELSKG